jgi:hypothetical protein
MARLVPRSFAVAAPKRGPRETPAPPRWIKPQLCKLAAKARGPGWVHEVKFDGYRMAADHLSARVATSGPGFGPPDRESYTSVGSFKRPFLSGLPRRGLSRLLSGFLSRLASA